MLNSKDVGHQIYSERNLSFKNLFASFMFSPPDSAPNTIMFTGLYEFAGRMRDNPDTETVKILGLLPVKRLRPQYDIASPATVFRPWTLNLVKDNNFSSVVNFLAAMKLLRSFCQLSFYVHSINDAFISIS